VGGSRAGGAEGDFFQEGAYRLHKKIQATYQNASSPWLRWALQVEWWSPHKQTSDERALQRHNASMVKMALADMGTGNVGARQGYITKNRQDNANARRKAAWRVSAGGGFTETDNQRLDREGEARTQRLAIRMYEKERDGVEWRLRSAWAHAKIKQVSASCAWYYDADRSWKLSIDFFFQCKSAYEKDEDHNLDLAGGNLPALALCKVLSMRTLKGWSNLRAHQAWQEYKMKKEEVRRERERQRRKEEADRTRRMLAAQQLAQQEAGREEQGQASAEEKNAGMFAIM
jgi:hypothetical protein